MLNAFGRVFYHNLLQVLESVGVEEMVAGLLEDASQVSVEALEVELDVFLFLAVD